MFNPISNYNYLAFKQQNNNAISMSDREKKVLEKTNRVANAYQFVDASVASDDKKEKFIEATKNALLMPVMSSTPISTAYVISQYHKGELSKDEATKVVALNTLVNTLNNID